ncbi:predicted protein [Nematostella vectensis]|uniref:Heme-binding protein 2 n=1 Tax=Nematostella vectensis TaxID=45351 RepID=A8DUT0_NEMVE|nr:heme-binding protein 2 [Nematostella vectensis]EDO27844.1 predicted protein [Nematostella vectensis]|eukprot:XP_001619944.1 hypothetical protein NEMVEDRAFT_v1g223649 [Nematostella vectensis]
MGVCFSRHDDSEEDDEPKDSFTKPTHYRKREGPRYCVLNFTQDYQYRQYEPSTWVCVRINGVSYKTALKSGSLILTKYFQGHNGPEKEMPETCPVRVQIDFKQDLGSNGDFVVSMHLPWENRARPPAPKHPDMFIQDFPEQFAYAQIFEGVPNEGEVKERLDNLTVVLERGGLGFERFEYFSSRFESPFSLKKKTHEVMVIAKNK